MARTDIDVVHVCTPNSSHAEISIAALQSGKHVMCEKPMAKTAAEAKAMLDAAKATGKLLTIGYQNRFREDSLFMKNLCADGRAGRRLLRQGLRHPPPRRPRLGRVHGQGEAGRRPPDRPGHPCPRPDPVDDGQLRARDRARLHLRQDRQDRQLGQHHGPLGSRPSSRWKTAPSAWSSSRTAPPSIVESSWALNMIVSNEAMTMLCGTKAGADMFPPDRPGRADLRLAGGPGVPRARQRRAQRQALHPELHHGRHVPGRWGQARAVRGRHEGVGRLAQGRARRGRAGGQARAGLHGHAASSKPSTSPRSRTTSSSMARYRRARSRT